MTRPLSLTVILILPLLAGCISTTAHEVDVAAAPEPEVREVQWNGTGYMRPHVFACDVQPLGWCAGITPFATDRVFEWEPNGTLTSLRVEVGWEPQSAQTAEFNVSVRDPEAQKVLFEARGPPPLVLDLSGLNVTSDLLWITVMAAPLVDGPANIVVEDAQDFVIAVRAEILPTF